MKAIQVITHPVTLIISFLFILISGEHWGGFYILYLLLALPHGGLHALLGFVGIVILVIAMNKKLETSRYNMFYSEIATAKLALQLVLN